MDLKLYKAAESGDIGAFRDCPVPLHQVLTICKNTILHVFLSAQLVNEQDSKKTAVQVFADQILDLCPKILMQKNDKEEIPLHLEVFVDQILDLCPEILMQKNDKEEIPLHLAARYGYEHVVNVLIRHAKKLGRSGSDDMRIPNKEKDTALHEAAKNNCLSIVKILKQEDRSSLPYPANDLGHTPLYIAARLGYSKVVAELLKGSQIVDGSGAAPNGRTALHAAVDSLNQKTVKVLLEHDKRAAYIGDKDGKTALHLAAAVGSWLIMETIVSHCPDCCEQVDNKGWNALHYAAANGRNFIIFSSIKNKRLRILLNDKDYIHGNTPVHLLAALGSKFLGTNMRAINKQEHDSLGIYAGKYNNSTKQILESLEASGYSKSLKSIEYVERLEKARASHLIVATLIATVTFAAAFTMPGGLKSDDDGGELGTPILSRNAAFKTFVVTDALAMVLSSTAVFIHFLLPLCRSKSLFSSLFWISLNVIICAIGAMMVAFVSGTYAVLSPSLGLAITTCIICLTFFPFAFFFSRRIIQLRLIKLIKKFHKSRVTRALPQ